MEPRPELPIQGVPYARWIAVAGVAVLVFVLVVVLVTKPQLRSGLAPGTKAPPFAVPLATGSLERSADIAVHPHEGQRGNVPACRVRGAEVLNICQLYERGPVVLALFLDAESCPAVLTQMQSAARRFPEVSFAAVAIKAGLGQARRLARARALSIPLGFDEQGALAALYRVLSCPQITFIYPGGTTQGQALLREPSAASLDARVSSLVTAARARGWQGP